MFPNTYSKLDTNTTTSYLLFQQSDIVVGEHSQCSPTMISICLSQQFTILFIKLSDVIRQLVITTLNRRQHKFSAWLFLEIALAIFFGSFFNSVELHYFPENNTNINYKSCPGINIKQCGQKHGNWSVRKINAITVSLTEGNYQIFSTVSGHIWNSVRTLNYSNLLTDWMNSIAFKVCQTFS